MSNSTLDALSRFQGFPYLVTRVAPTFYHVILLPEDFGQFQGEVVAQAQIEFNQLDTALVLADDRAVYFTPNGVRTESDHPPSGGLVVSRRLWPIVDCPETENLRRRREALIFLEQEGSARGGFMFGDLGKGGRAATVEEVRRLAGHQRPRIPNGLRECATCGEWRGVCLDSSNELSRWVVPVHCRCENQNRCARCGRHLHARRLNANYFNVRDGQIIHVPGFCAFEHRCRGTAPLSWSRSAFA